MMLTYHQYNSALSRRKYSFGFPMHVLQQELYQNSTQGVLRLFFLQLNFMLVHWLLFILFPILLHHLPKLSQHQHKSQKMPRLINPNVCLVALRNTACRILKVELILVQFITILLILPLFFFNWGFTPSVRIIISGCHPKHGLTVLRRRCKYDCGCCGI